MSNEEYEVTSMPATPDFTAPSYRLHERAYDVYSMCGARASHAAAWLERGTINCWRFDRMYACADSLLEAFPGATWLTVGDGRFGMDAIYLQEHGAQSFPTDISGTLLEESKSKGLIRDYRVENAESLSFQDQSFDFVFCKESYHHFPRPMCALYEMLRVARRAVLLIEPNDQTLPVSAVAKVSRLAKDLVKQVLRRPTDYHGFEEAGNYVYSISRREVEKVALGLGFTTVAFRGVNDYYLPGVEFEPAVPESALFRRVSGKIAKFDLRCKLGISQPSLLATIIFKIAPSRAVEDALLRDKFDVVNLPKNPYVSTSRPSDN